MTSFPTTLKHVPQREALFDLVGAMVYYLGGAILETVMVLTGPFTSIQEQIERGVTILKGGGVIAYPTDTVYGLGASAYLRQAVERVFEIKQRPRNLPLPLLIADVSQLSELAAQVPPVARSLTDKFWPGGLTIIFRKSARVPDFLTDGGDTIGVRIPAHPVPIALVKGLGAPIVGTSANLSGRPSALTAEEVRSQIGDKVDLIIDGGHSPGGKESTVIDVTGETPVVVREGVISRETLERVCGRVIKKEAG